MSHDCGSVLVLTPAFHIGPDTGEAQSAPNTWQKALTHTPAPTGTKFVILHFMNVTLPANNRLEVDLGYGTDVFTAADGGAFWTRPINVGAVGSSIVIRYVTNGANTGGAFVDRYGRGESLQTMTPGHDSITNCNPFLLNGWVEPNFPHVPGSTAPKYDPFWICNKSAAPEWQNARCAPLGSVQRIISQSVGMIVSVHPPDGHHPNETVSTCSVTLIDSDLVVLAAHCISNHPFEVPTSSVTFDYEVQCDGSLVPAYSAVFYKVIRLVKYRYTDGRDYAILQLRGTPPVPSVPIRISDLASNENTFGVHHPNGAVKKVSPSATSLQPIKSFGSMINVDLDVAGGSSGSALLDSSGNVVGVLSSGSGCNLYYSAMKTMMSDPIIVPNPPAARAVMLVIDRSGSMSESAGGGKIKINEARTAAALFVSMVRTNGNQAGLVSFSSDASNPVDFGLANVTNGSKTQMNNKVAAIGPGGATSIGDGLAAARDQLAGAAALPRSILVLTDGMENTPQAIADVTAIGGISITAIGFGAESNLDGARLSNLAQTHGGLYKRAGDGLELRKFFALAFGEIFEAGALADPQLLLPANASKGADVPFHVCGEEAVTVVIGWDDENAPLQIEVETPTGQILNLTAGGIEMDAGITWRFARIPLPQHGERDGLWKTRVWRPRNGGEFSSFQPAVNYFVNVIARGGPSLRPFSEPRRLYTGDVLRPRVMLQFADETVPVGGEVSLALRRPAKSVGTILAGKGLGSSKIVNGDVLPARQATLKTIEQSTGAPVSGYVESNYVLTDDPAGGGTFRPAGIFGKRLEDVLVVEGTYTFHAKARVAMGCTATRECLWSYHVSVGIDPDSTKVTTETVGTGLGGDRVRVVFTPQDRYGNLVGPGAGDELEVAPLPGCTLTGGLVDLGDGRYSQEVLSDPESDDGPGVLVGQADRDPVVVAPPTRDRTTFRYTTALVCGVEGGECCECAALAPGRYATAVTLHNWLDKEVRIALQVFPTTFAGATSGRWPNAVPRRVEDKITLAPGSATTIDCCSIAALLLGAAAPAGGATTHGVISIESNFRINVSAVYTAAGRDGASVSIDVERIEPVESRVRVAVERSKPRRPTAARVQMTPPPRPQDIAREEGRKEQNEKKSKGSAKQPSSQET